MAKLYALCVGVNKYKNSTISTLKGAVPDANRMISYLEKASKNTEYDFHGVLIEDEAATKASIVKEFKEHLGKAKAGDIAVFYFSGHGAEEEADPVFARFSPRKTLNTIVCHDSRTEGVADLADKEIRYLIRQIAGNEAEPEKNPHFVLMMDSCHSGGTTRGEIVPRLTGKYQQRPWEQFIFHKDISYETVKNTISLDDVLPQGMHIALSSAQGDELAYELDEKGIFTNGFFEIIERTAGKISYADLNSRIRLMFKGRYPQRPTLYEYTFKGQAESLKKQPFLGGAVENKETKANLVFNPTPYQWELDLGAIHGMATGEEAANLSLKVIDNNEKILTELIPNKVLPSTTLFEVEDGILDMSETYSVLVSGIYRSSIYFYVGGETEAVAAFNKYLDAQDGDAEVRREKRKKRDNIYFTDDITKANYKILAKDGEYIITLPYNDLPLIEQQDISYKHAKTNLMMFTRSIAKWEFLKELTNLKTRLEPTHPIAIQLYSKTGSKPYAIENNQIKIKDGDAIRIHLKNETRRDKLYHALFYMDMTFGITPLSNGQTSLAPGQVLKVEDDWAIPVALSDYIKPFNFKEEFFDLKLIVSTTPITIDHLEQEALSPPVFDAFKNVDNHRSFKRRNKPSAEWTAYSIRCVIPNKAYKSE